MTTSRPTLLSIVIPTKDRYDTLLPVLRSLTSHIDADDVEFVVQDNSASNARMADAPTDPRIVYHHSAAPVSIVDNTIACLKASRGEYLTFIGDDDLVSPHIVEAVRQLKATGQQCLVYTPARYWWSTVEFSKPTAIYRPKAFWMPPIAPGAPALMDSKAELERFVASGATQYLRLPRFYHGIVRRDALEAIERATGTMLPGSSPDIAFSTALCLVMPQYLSVEYPLTVYGASRVSGGGWTAARRHHGRIEDQPHLPKDIVERWDPRLPRFWSEQTIYPQTVQEVLRRFGSDRVLDYEVLYASLIANEPYLIGQFLPFIARFYRRHPARLPRLGALVAKKLGGRLRRSVRSRFALMPYEFREFDDVEQAMRFLASQPAPAFRADARS